MKSRIYLDHNASTPIDPRVLSALTQELNDTYGNPSSVHSFGQEVRNRLTRARRIVATFLGVKPAEIIFTSGGTEAINMVIRGFLGEHPKGHIISSSVEHSCVYKTLKHFETQGCEVTFLNPGSFGAPHPEDLEKAIKPNTRLVVLMSVNNETGVKTDINAIAALLEEKGIPFVVDGVAHLGKELFLIPSGISAMCFSGHKFHAPKGIGFAFVRSNFKFTPLLLGGGQENTKRGGTENLAMIVALTEAVVLVKNSLPKATQTMQTLRDRFEQKIMNAISDVAINGKGPRICNTSNLSFAGVDGESLMMSLDLAGVAASHGSACSSGALEPSRILLNMGISIKEAGSSMRFSLSCMTTEEEIDRAADIVIDVVTRLRAIGPSADKAFIPSSNE
jgi:cysteine desulfurase